MKYFMIFLDFDATSLDDAKGEMQLFVSKLPETVKRLTQSRNVKEWKVISHSVSLQENKGFLSILVEIQTT